MVVSPAKMLVSKVFSFKRAVPLAMIPDIPIRFSDILIVTIATLLISLLVRLYKKKWIRFLKLAFILPGPQAYPLIGNALEFACDPKDLLDRIVKIIIPYIDSTPIRIWMGPMLCVIITKPRDIEVILNSQQATNKGFPYKFLKPFIGEGLISGSGPIWKRHRKMVAHILTQKVLDGFLEVFDRHSRASLKKLKSESDGKIIDILEPFEGCTLDLVCESVMGCSDIESLIESNQNLIHYSSETYRVIHDRMMKVWLYPDWIYKLTENYKILDKGQKVIANFIEKCIAEIKKKRKLGKSENGKSILERLLDIIENSGLKISDEEFKDEMITIYLAAQDTLAVISSFATLMLGIHQDIQEEARKEVELILGNDRITPENISQLKMVEKIIKETLRLFPIAPMMARTSTGEIKLDSCTIPKDCQVILLPFVTHRSSQYWKDPEKFNPERFCTEEIAKRDPFSFIPFSAGPISCIGQRYAMMGLKTIISNLLRNFKISSQVKMKDINLKTDLSIRSTNGYKVSLTPL